MVLVLLNMILAVPAYSTKMCIKFLRLNADTPSARDANIQIRKTCTRTPRPLWKIFRNLCEAKHDFFSTRYSLFVIYLNYVMTYR